MTLTSEEALRVARFCWPTCAHEHMYGAEGVGFSCARLHDSRMEQFDSGDRDSIAAAELALVERGLADRYGLALRRQDPHRPHRSHRAGDPARRG